MFQMFSFDIYKKVEYYDKSKNDNLIYRFNNEDEALKFCINKNFELINEFFPFYDSENEIGNNLYYYETPEYHFKNKYNLQFYDYKTIKTDIKNEWQLTKMRKILEDQEKFIYPDHFTDFRPVTFYHIKKRLC